MSEDIKKCAECEASLKVFWEQDDTTTNIRLAIQKYYLDLDNREHGGVAMDEAFNKIQKELGMSWKQGEIKDMLEANPACKVLFR